MPSGSEGRNGICRTQHHCWELAGPRVTKSQWHWTRLLIELSPARAGPIPLSCPPHPCSKAQELNEEMATTTQMLTAGTPSQGQIKWLTRIAGDVIRGGPWPFPWPCWQSSPYR
jgi:hypothetical protein